MPHQFVNLLKIYHEAKAREADVLIFQTGGNDSAYEREEGNHLVPIEKFRKNLEKIIKKAKNLSDKIVFIGFKNVDEKKTMPVAWRDIYYKNENIRKYNETTKEICAKNNVLFLDIFGTLNMQDLADGLHPNTNGHEKLYQKVKSFLLEYKLI